MLKYMNAEFYKVTHRVYPAGFLGVIVGGIALIMVLLRQNAGPGASFDFMAGALCMVLSVGLYLVVITCDMVFSDQYKYNTLKNEVAYGLPRARIYLGKLIAAAIVSVVLCAVILAFYLLLARLLFPLGAATGETMTALGQALLVAFPLWLGGMGLFHMLLFLMKGSTAASIVYVLVVAVLGGGTLELFSKFVPRLRPVIEAIQTCLLTTPFDRLLSGGPSNGLIAYAWIVGMAWLLGSTALGLIVFRKREIS
ncbi:MAG: ABC transporter permease [Pseudoflavonifractor sp.]|nr:ABC transporter permease [Pseudoflavonifractor sp.]MDY3020161.1 ABC transporter permease [Oscillospiraceae bacterium]